MMFTTAKIRINNEGLLSCHLRGLLIPYASGHKKESMVFSLKGFYNPALQAKNHTFFLIA